MVSKKTDVERMNTILFTILEQIKNISILLNPIIPIATNKALNILNIPIKKRNINNIKNKNLLNIGKSLNKYEILFKKIENDN